MKKNGNQTIIKDQHLYKYCLNACTLSTPKMEWPGLLDGIDICWCLLLYVHVPWSFAYMMMNIKAVTLFPRETLLCNIFMIVNQILFYLFFFPVFVALVMYLVSLCVDDLCTSQCASCRLTQRILVRENVCLSESQPYHKLSVRIPLKRLIYLPFVMSEWCWRELLLSEFPVWSHGPLSYE